MASRQFKFTIKPRPSPPNKEVTSEVIHIVDSDSENDECVAIAGAAAACSSVRASSGPLGGGVHMVDEGKAAWKSLMSRMQQSQKNIPLTGSKGSKKGVKRGMSHSSPRGNSVDTHTNSVQKKPKLSYGSSHSKTLASLVTVPGTAPSAPPRPGPNTKWIPGTLSLVPINADGNPGAPIPKTRSGESWSLLFEEEDLSQIKGWSGDRTEVQLNEIGNGYDTGTGGGATNSKKAPRPCPFYKKIPGTTFSVDAFNFGEIPGVEVYFLSHFHSDHYIGLTKKFSKTIICDPATGNLINMKLGVSENCIRRLELNRIYMIQGTQVVLINANHCPGSVIFILRLPNGTNIVHTGDFRFTPDMLVNPFLASLKVHCLYLDTTYCDPKYDFPSQTDAISQVVATVKRHISYRPKTLVICGAYCIGKERVFFTLAEAIKTKVFCAPDKRRMIKELENARFNNYMSETEASADIHVVPMKNLHTICLSEYLAHRSAKYTNIIAIKPTGWEFSRTGQGFSSKSFNKDTLTIIGVPYSEHSSFSELQEFVTALKPVKVQPTVNVGSEPKRAAMMEHISKWLSS